MEDKINKLQTFSISILNPLSANLQNGQTHSNNCLSVFDHFVGLVLKGLMLSFLVFNKKLLICVETERERERERERE